MMGSEKKTENHVDVEGGRGEDGVNESVYVWVLDASCGKVFRYDGVEDVERFVVERVSSDCEWMVSEEKFPVVVDLMKEVEDEKNNG